MSKLYKAQTAGAVCKEGVASTVGGAVDAINGRPGAAELRKRLNTVRTLAEIETIVRGFAKDAARQGPSPHHAPARANEEDDTTASSTVSQPLPNHSPTTPQPPITNH